MSPIEIAMREYGVRDILGIKNNPRVLQYFSDIGQKWVTDDDTAWCAAFVNWCLKQSNRIYTGALNARNFLHYSTPTKTPILGDIVVLWRITKQGPYGHVGFYVSETETDVYILGGNQQNQVCILPYSKARVLDYRTIPPPKNA